MKRARLPAVVSLVPALALAVVAASAVGGPEFEASGVALVGRYLLPAGRDLVLDALRNTTGIVGTTVVGLVVLAWSSLRLFRGLNVAFSRVYGSSPRRLDATSRTQFPVECAVRFRCNRQITMPPSSDSRV